MRKSPAPNINRGRAFLVYAMKGGGLMKLPPFEEFEKTITDEQREEWFSSANFRVYENPPPTAKRLADIAILAGYLSARGMMAAYHTWLVQQLSNYNEPR